MRGLLAAAALAVALATLQTSGCASCAALGVNADLLLLFVLGVGMRRGETAGALAGIALGLVAGTFSAGLPGVAILTLGALGFAAGGLRERLDCDSPNTQAIVAVAATLGQGLVHLALLETFSEGRGVVAPLLGVVVPAAAVNGALLPAGLYLLRACGRWRNRARAAADAQAG